jgi:hypothetical protein
MPALPSDLTSALEEAIVEYLARRDDILDTIVGLRTNRLVEQCRRHLEGLRLKSTYNSDKIRTLEKLVADLRAELAPLTQQVLVKRAQLAFAEQELAAYRRIEAELADERAERKATGMYAEAARFIDVLFRDHAVDRGHFAGLGPADITAIAAIIAQAAATSRSSQAVKATLAKAGNR